METTIVLSLLVGPNAYEHFLSQIGEAFDLSHAVKAGDAIGTKREHNDAWEQHASTIESVVYAADPIVLGYSPLVECFKADRAWQAQRRETCAEEVRRHGFCRHCESK